MTSISPTFSELADQLAKLPATRSLLELTMAAVLQVTGANGFRPQGEHMLVEHPTDDGRYIALEASLFEESGAAPALLLRAALCFTEEVSRYHGLSLLVWACRPSEAALAWPPHDSAVRALRFAGDLPFRETLQGPGGLETALTALEWKVTDNNMSFEVLSDEYFWRLAEELEP